MRFIDRALAAVLAFVVIGLITIVAIAPDSLRVTLAGIEEINLVLRVAVVVVLNVLILIGLYLSLRSPRKEITGLAVRAPGAYTDVSIESARKLILAAVENVPDVVSATATVKAVNGKADVDMNVQVTGHDIHIPKKQKEINRALRQVINKQLGLQMRGRPRVHIYLHGEQPVSGSVVAPSPALESKVSVQTPPAPLPSPAVSTPAPKVADTDDTLVEAKQEEKAPVSLFGTRDDKDEQPAKEEATNNNWLSSFISGNNKQDKTEDEQK